jgi:spermidine synthase
LQFNSWDEYRYHEALVHPALSPLTVPRRVLVLGGGDGLAVREILRYPSIDSVTLVDLDPGMTSLADRFPPLAKLSRSSLKDPRVTIVNQDAFVWIGRDDGARFDAVIIDFPDPGTFSIGKLYTTRFYRMLRSRLNSHSLVSIQCTSPLVAPQSYWCIVTTLEAAGYRVRPYHASVPTFGEWGYALASIEPIPDKLPLSPDVSGSLSFLDDDVLNSLFELPRDLARVKTQVNQLNSQALVHYYDQEWGAWK